MPQKNEVAQNGTAPERKPSEQALQVVDRAVGAVPVVADAVRDAATQLSKPEARERAEVRGADIRRQVTEQVVDQARKARERVEPVYRERVEPVYKQRVEPVYRERVEPVYKQRVEPTVRRVRERI